MDSWKRIKKITVVLNYFAPWPDYFFLEIANMLRKLAGIVFLFFPVFAFAQVAPATRGSGLDLWVGAEFSNFQPDWGFNRMSGITVLGNVNGIFFHKLGAEGEARWLRFNQYQGETQDHYLIGPRYRFFRLHQASFYAKFLMGGGFITYPNKIGSGSYFAYVPGATVEYRLSHHWAVRGDYEYQFWPSAPGLAFTFPNPSNGLNPNGFSVGASYRIF
jgi:opacity protein-like surface antigen